MKKIFFIATVAILGLTSCKKDYTCECTTTITQPEFQYGGTVVQPASTQTASASATITDKKKDAEAKCEEGTKTTSTPSAYAQLGAQPTTASTKCSIK